MSSLCCRVEDGLSPHLLTADCVVWCVVLRPCSGNAENPINHMIENVRLLGTSLQSVRFSLLECLLSYRCVAAASW